MSSKGLWFNQPKLKAVGNQEQIGGGEQLIGNIGLAKEKVVDPRLPAITS